MDYKLTSDGSNTLYSDKYSQTFHSLQDGAFNESLNKYVIPALKIFANAKELNILDICFGLGYNTLATIYYIKKFNLATKINFFSPELDLQLIESLQYFEYPNEFANILYILKELSINKYYKDNQFTISVFIGDAREYIKDIDSIDIVYQDAFSSETNQELWTKEYFADIAKTLSKKAIIATYSIATPVRMSMYENNLYIYEYQSSVKRRGTIASTFLENNNDLKMKFIDMEKKKLNSPNCSPLLD